MPENACCRSGAVVAPVHLSGKSKQALGSVRRAVPFQPNPLHTTHPRPSSLLCVVSLVCIFRVCVVVFPCGFGVCARVHSAAAGPVLRYEKFENGAVVQYTRSWPAPVPSQTAAHGGTLGLKVVPCRPRSLKVSKVCHGILLRLRRPIGLKVSKAVASATAAEGDTAAKDIDR